MSATCDHDWQLTETGYVRTWATEIDHHTKEIRAMNQGSEDWDEGANDDHLRCLTCGKKAPIPAGYQVVFS